MANDSEASLTSQTRVAYASAFCSLQRLSSIPWNTFRMKGGARHRGNAVFLCALSAFLLCCAASAATQSHAAVTESPPPSSCVYGRSPSRQIDNSTVDMDRGGEACQRARTPPSARPPDLQSSSAAALPCDKEQAAGGVSDAEENAEMGRSVRLLCSREKEQQIVGAGSLIDGRYLLVDLLHPRPWEPQRHPQTRYTSSDQEHLAVQLRVRKQSPTQVTASNGGGCEQSDKEEWDPRSSVAGFWQWRERPSITSHTPLLALLPPSGIGTTISTGAGDALAAAVVSAHSELVVARQRDDRSEGFCIDPLIILRTFPFWRRRAALPLPPGHTSSSSSGSDTSSGRYRVFDRLGGGAYGEVWRAVSLDSAAPFVDTVLKRVRCRRVSSLNPEVDEQQQEEDEERVRRGFAREVFFGLWLRGEAHIARFIEVLSPDQLGIASGDSAGVVTPASATDSPSSSAAAPDAAAAAASAAAAFLPEMSRNDLLTAVHTASQSCEGRWLVFANEGSSLTHLFFVADAGGSGLLKPSALWWQLKSSSQRLPPPRHVRQIAARTSATALAAADAPFVPLLLQLQQSPNELLLFLRSLLQQLLLALQAVHRRHVTHRDVKLENVLLKSSLPLEVRLADWGSAVSHDKSSPVAQALKAILGDESPSLLEETDGYQPPEVWAEAAANAEQQTQQHDWSSPSANVTDSLHRPPSYDMWGVGLIFLKLALGTPAPLESLDSRRSARLARQLREKPLAVLRRDMLVMTLGDLCLIPWASDRLPTPAPPTAVTAPAHHSFFSSLKSALVTAVDGLYRRWVGLFCGEDDPPHSVEDSQDDDYDLRTRATAIAAHGNSSLQIKERRQEELFELLSRVRGQGGGGELVVRQQLAVQLQQASGQQPPFADSDGDEGVQPRTAPTHHHSECNDSLFAEILRGKDPAGVGIPNPLARDFLRKLLAYDLQERLTAEAALKHPWFSVAAEAAGAVDERKANKP